MHTLKPVVVSLKQDVYQQWRWERMRKGGRGGGGEGGGGRQEGVGVTVL